MMRQPCQHRSQRAEDPPPSLRRSGESLNASVTDCSHAALACCERASLALCIVPISALLWVNSPVCRGRSDGAPRATTSGLAMRARAACTPSPPAGPVLRTETLAKSTTAVRPGDLMPSAIMSANRFCALRHKV